MGLLDETKAISTQLSWSLGGAELGNNPSAHAPRDSLGDNWHLHIKVRECPSCFQADFIYLHILDAPVIAKLSFSWLVQYKFPPGK